MSFLSELALNATAIVVSSGPTLEDAGEVFSSMEEATNNTTEPLNRNESTVPRSEP